MPLRCDNDERMVHTREVNFYKSSVNPIKKTFSFFSFHSKEQDENYLLLNEISNWDIYRCMNCAVMQTIMKQSLKNKLIIN